MKQAGIIFILTYMVLVSCAQNTSLVFSSKNSSFTLKINNITQNKQPTTYLRILNYNESVVHVSINLPNSMSKIDTNLTFETGAEVQFQIFIENNKPIVKWEKNLSYNSILPIEKGQLEVFYKDKYGKTHKNIQKKEIYTGEKGCDRPIPRGTITNCKNFMKESNIDSDRYSTASKSLKNICLSSSQVIEIIDLFEDDSFKEKFILYSYKNLFDVDNFQLILAQVPLKNQESIKKKLKL